MGPNRHSLDEDSATRLLQGAVHPDDAPPGYASVAELLAAAASLPAVGEDSGAPTVTAMVEAVRNSAPVPAPAETRRRRTSTLGKLFAGKALAAAATVVLTAGAAAAAVGTLPTPVQGVVADAVSHIGIDLPDHHGHGKAGDSADDQTDDNGVNDDDTTSTTGGTENHGDDEGTDAGKGEVISGITHDPALDGQPKGPTVCAEASDGQCKAGEDHGGDSGSGSDNSGPGSNSGNGNTTPGTPRGGADDPAGHDAGDDHGGTTSTTVTTATTTSSPTTTTTADGGTGASGNSGNNSGKGKGKGRSGTDD